MASNNAYDIDRAAIAPKPKPKLSFWDIWNMSFGFLGIQFGFALQNANVSRIFQTLGAEIDDIPILWIAAPVTGLIVQPIIGYMSDRTWNKLGRRRPFFLVGAICASIALILMPNSPTLWMAAGMLWILDASINISMEPFRAFVGDNLSDEQRTLGFSMQSFFIGVGAVVGSLLPYAFTNWFGISNTAPEGVIPPSVQWSFYIGAIVFLLAVLWTVFRSKEYPPEDLIAFEKYEKKEELTEPELSDVERRNLASTQLKYALPFLIIGAALIFIVAHYKLNKELHILGFGLATFGLLFASSGYSQKNGASQNGFTNIMNDLFSMPSTMRQLAWVQFFSWFALFSMWIYTTSAVTQHIYGTTDTSSQAYNDGADWVSWLFAIYNGVAAIAAFVLPWLAKMYNRKITHIISLLLGAVGLISIYFIKDANLLMLSMVGVGFAWASILAMPYAMLTGSLPASKMGYFMGVFNFFIVIPQILAATVLGFLVGRLFGGDAAYALIIGGSSFLVAAFLTTRVEDKGASDA